MNERAAASHALPVGSRGDRDGDDGSGLSGPRLTEMPALHARMSADDAAPRPPESGPRLYAAVVVLGLAPAVGLGMTRFAYALLLPDMRESLAWSYAEAGFMNTANAAGYLAGAVSGTLAVRRLGAFRAVIAGTALCVLSLFAMALTADFLVLSTARLVSGIAAAYAFVAGGLLAARIGALYPHRQALLLSLFYVGPGIGFILSALLIPPLAGHLGAGSWPIGWAALGTAAALLTAVLVIGGPADPAAASAGVRTRLQLADRWLLLVGYLLYGAGLTAYMTFVIAWLIATGQSVAVQSATWACIGAGILAGPWLWQRAIVYPVGGRGAALLIGANAVGVAVPLFGTLAETLMLSALLVGSVCFSVVAASTAYVRRSFQPSLWPAGIAAMTCMFGVGQIVGPILAGVITDYTGRLTPALWTAALLLAGGAALAALQRDSTGAGAADRGI